MHAYGDHSLCCETKHDWCLASQAIKENKSYNHKPVFKVGVKKDEVRAQKAQEYHDSMCTEEKFKQMRHLWHTQINEMLNMRAAETAPKSKNFSRTGSLKYRIQHVIGTHNAGYSNFNIALLGDLKIDPMPIFAKWLVGRDEIKLRNGIRQKTNAYKRKRMHKRDAKNKSELLIERTKSVKDGDYGSCIGVFGSPKKKRKTERPPCKCGGLKAHKNKNSKYCLFGKSNIDTSDKT